MAISEKIFYKIGEACREIDVQPYVLRYWETEFPALSPEKSRSGQRVYTSDELEIIRRIKELLYDEGYTIAGAKKKLDGELSRDGKLDRTPEEAAKPTPEVDGPSAVDAPSERAESDGELAAARDRIVVLEDGIRSLLNQANELLEDLEGARQNGATSGEETA